jgi:hypothetical protein
MRFSRVLSGAGLLAASILFSACSGGMNGAVPSSGGAGMSSMARVAPAQIANTAAGTKLSPCAEATYGKSWVFEGSCNVFVLKPAGGTEALAKYGTNEETIKVGFGKNNETSPTEIIFADGAKPGTDITGTFEGAKFPPYSGSLGKAFLYTEIVNSTKDKISFSSTPAFVATAKTFPGKTCTVIELTSKGVWESAGLKSTVKKDGSLEALTIGSVPISGFFYIVGGGADYLGIACK